MKPILIGKITAALLVFSSAPFAASAADMVDPATVKKLTAYWENRPKLALAQMVAKYGQPQEATDKTIVWHNAGPFKRITLCNVETPHSFPKPHVDFLQHTISMKVPAGKADELEAFDGSNSFSRTEGEISAKCDSEAHNVLTLNLIHEILDGKKTVAEARKAFDQAVIEDLSSQPPAIMQALAFDPAAKPAPDPDRVTIPGAPEPMAKSDEAKADAKILAVVAAIDENEIMAAEEAEMRKQLSPEVMEFAKTMHKEHGMNIAQVMKLGENAEARPVETATSEGLHVKGAGELAALVPLDDKAFGAAYIAAMVKGHTEALDTIDNNLLKEAQSEGVKKFLTETRGHVAMHLEMASKLQTALAAK